MKSYALSDIGRCRDDNEDAVYATDHSIGMLDNLYVVADGMGGHQAGDYASNYAITRICQLIEEQKGETPSQLLNWVYSQINNEIYSKGLEKAVLTGMGTTLVCCTISKDGIMTVANVGDSRLYVHRKDNSWSQITRDHSYVEELVRKGQLDRNSPAYLKGKNVITRAIGAEAQVSTDIYQIETDQIDHIMLCSDGLSNMLTDEQISEIAADSLSIQDRAISMVEKANQAGGTDNISVVLIDLTEEESA